MRKTTVVPVGQSHKTWGSTKCLALNSVMATRTATRTVTAMTKTRRISDGQSLVFAYATSWSCTAHPPWRPSLDWDKEDNVTPTEQNWHTSPEGRDDICQRC